jgi:hypothetical protein
MSSSNRATAVPSRPRASAAVSRLLGEIQHVLGVEPIDSITVAGQLKAVAEAFTLNPSGPVNPPLGGRQKLGLVPGLPLPPVTAAGQTFSISHSVNWSFSEGGRAVPAEDIDAENLNIPEIDVLIKPKVVEARPRAESPRDRDLRTVSPAVRLTLTLRLGNETVSSGPVTLPGPDQLPTVIRVLPVEVPTLLALFRHKRFAPRSGPFEGFAFVDVSRPAGLTDDRQLTSLLSTVAKVARPLTTAFPSLPIVLNDLGVLARRIFVDQPLVRVVSHQAIPELKRFGIPNPDSALDAGNSTSALIFIAVGTGPDSRAVECWSGKAGDKNDPYFTLTNGNQGFAIIEDLHSDRPVTLPAQGQFVRGKKPGGGNTFGDAISAIRFLPPEKPLT